MLANKKVFLKILDLTNFIFYLKINNYYFKDFKNRIIDFLSFNINFLDLKI